MLRSLRSKLILSYLAIAVLTALSIYALILATSDQRLKTLILEQQIIELRDEAARWYASEGNWSGFPDYFQVLHPPPQRERPAPGAPLGERPTVAEIGMHGIVTVDRQVLVPFRTYLPSQTVPEALLANATPVEVNGETVGWVIPDESTGISLQAEETVYLQRTNQVLLSAGALAVIAAMLMGIWFARVLLRPIYALTDASEQMAQGQLKQQVTIHTDDELGKLASSFNSMSHEVALGHQRRRQLTADIAHDLSTPLQIIAGYVETIQDGTLKPTPKRMDVIATEVEHLRRLIQDLNTLAETDSNTLSLNMQSVALDEYLPQVVSSFASLADEQQVALQLDALPAQLPTVQADQARLTQVLGNIVSNALRYTPEGGRIQIAVRALADAAQIRVKDSGSGIDPQSLPFVFDRFYQSDQARSTSGKMGLGLAISKGLVEAMGGVISAESAGKNQGATFVITLPT